MNKVQQVLNDAKTKYLESITFMTNKVNDYSKSIAELEEKISAFKYDVKLMSQAVSTNFEANSINDLLEAEIGTCNAQLDILAANLEHAKKNYDDTVKVIHKCNNEIFHINHFLKNNGSV